MKKHSWQITLGLVLVILSALFYFWHFLLFHDAHHIFIYMLGDIAFVPIEVLLVTLIIHRLLTIREKRSMLKKLNMVIGAFFNEVGTSLLEHLSKFNTRQNDIVEKLIITNKWSEKDFYSLITHLKRHPFEIDPKAGNLDELKIFLLKKRSFLLGLLRNPNLLEHESFTDLLWAVTHLTEELSFRKNVDELGETDANHVAGDIKRAYSLLIIEWLRYMRHLKSYYPYLFSLAVRTNPFNPDATVEIK